MLNLDRLNKEFEVRSPHEIISWVVDAFSPNVAMSCSFQPQSLPLLHIVSQVAPGLRIFFLDTGYHFPETLLFRDRLVKEWKLKVENLHAAMPRNEFVGLHGEDLYRRDPDQCCYINKVEPMQRAMIGLKAWISGIRRDQTSMRANLQVLEMADRGVVRVHPMAKWTNKDIWEYIHDNDLPEHPLHSQGYLSIGCAPCTQPVQAGENERSGRWKNQQKTECGLHTLLRHNSNSPLSVNSEVSDQVISEAEPTQHD